MHFRVAPWSRLLIWATIASCVILLGVAFAAAQVIPRMGAAHWIGMLVAAVPAVIAFGSLLFIVSDYELDQRQLRVKRLLWWTRVDLTGLTRVFREPAGFKGSLRVMGNGGMFSFTGIFWSRALGRYRLFATDPARFVVLVTPGRTIVVSPEEPEAFIHAAERFLTRG
jgi:Bacterial PH domain